jgi:hypothetical protein
MKTLEERLHDGSRAKEVIENEQFQASFDAIEAEVMETWKNTPARDNEGREACYVYLKMLQKVKAQLVYSLETGKLAELDLIHKQTLTDRLRTGLGSWAA